MIKRLLARFGYVPAADVYLAWHDGRVAGQEEVMEMCATRVKTVELQYSGIEIERDHLMKILADRAGREMPKHIIVG